MENLKFREGLRKSHHLARTLEPNSSSRIRGFLLRHLVYLP